MASLVRGAGLDARAAAVVMRVVRNIVDTGRTITCTIHQPSVDIFEVLTPFAASTAAVTICPNQVYRSSCSSREINIELTFRSA